MKVFRFGLQLPSDPPALTSLTPAVRLKKLFILQTPLIMLFYHSSIKFTNATVDDNSTIAMCMDHSGTTI